jgi:hypothetical protein
MQKLATELVLRQAEMLAESFAVDNASDGAPDQKPPGS